MKRIPTVSSGFVLIGLLVRGGQRRGLPQHPARLIKGLLLVVLLALTLGAGAANWTGGGTATQGWENLNNWEGGAVPTFNSSLDINYYNPGAGNLSSFLGGARTIRSLNFNASAAGDVRIHLANANPFTGASDLTLGGAGAAALTVDVAASGNFWIGAGGDAGTFGNLVLAENLTITNNGSGVLTIDRPITGAFAISKAGLGTLVLSGANTYTGLTTVAAGTLKNGSATTFANLGQLTVNGTGRFDLNGHDATFTIINAGANTGVITNSGALAVLTGSSQGGVTINTLIRGNVALQIANNMTVTTALPAANANTFTGGLTLLDGTSLNANGTRLRIRDLITGTPFGFGPITIGLTAADKAGILFDTVANNTLTNDVIFNTDLGNDAPGIRFDTLGNTLSGQLTAYVPDADAENVNVTFSSKKDSGGTGGVTVTGKITGGGGLALAPHYSSTTATLTVTLQSAPGLNDYAGDTTITRVGTSVYTLALGANEQIPNGAGKGNVVLTEAGCTLDLHGFSETINGLSGAGVVDNKVAGTATLTVGDSGGSSSFAGVLQNTAGMLALTKIGAGTLTLSGVNSYAGATTISTGKVMGVTGGSASNSAVTIASTSAAAGVVVADNTKSWTCASLATTAAGVLEFDFGAIVPSSSVASWRVTGAAAFTVRPTVTVAGSSLSVGDFPLLTWGSMSGAAPTNVALPAGVVGSLNVSNNTLRLVISSTTNTNVVVLSSPGMQVGRVTASNVMVTVSGSAGFNGNFQRATNVTFTLGVTNFPALVALADGRITNVDDFADLYGAPNAGIPPVAFYRVHTNPPMNVVLFLADDWRYDTLGCAGNPVVQTPNLDRLAAEGLRFSRACVVTAVCWHSRANIFAGQTTPRYLSNGSSGSANILEPQNWVNTFPAQLRSHGYWIGHVGKWHNGDFPTAEYDFSRPFFKYHWYTINGVQVHDTTRNEEGALEFLRTRPANKPFMLTVAPFAPHAQDGAPEQYLPLPETTNLYVNVTVPVPVNATDESFYRLPPFIALESNTGRNRYRKRFDTPEKYQTYMKNYYRLCTGVDTMFGHIMDELRQQGVLDNTLIIMIGDNGYYHAEHGLADKWYAHQESIRVPLLIRDPRLPAARRGQTNDVFALNIDLAPTILKAAGIPVPGGMQGSDLAPLYLDPTPPAWRTNYYYDIPEVGANIPGSEALVEKDWKYIYWTDFATEQLFHLATDPIEEQDLINDPAYAAQLAAMRVRFAELKAAAK